LATLVLGLIPVVTVFVAAQREEDAMGLLLPAAIGTAGLGLVIPFAWPNSLGGGAWLGVMVLLAVGSAIAGVRLHGLLKRVPLAWAGAVGSGFAALAATAVWAGGQRVRMDWDWKTAAIETFWGLIVDGALVWLVLWLLREMRPVAFSGRFLLVPVVTLAGGILLEKPEVGWTGWLGLGLAAGSGLVLIRPSMQGLFR
jgi:drug/metabolite transporter (DMT)-like permease